MYLKDKKKILFVIDKPNWAYDEIARFVANELKNYYDFYFIYRVKRSKTIKGQLYNLYSYFNELYYRKLSKNSQYDLVCYLWWESPELFKKNFNAKKSLVGLYTEGFPPGGSKKLLGLSQPDFVKQYISWSDGLMCGNRNIFNSYQKCVQNLYYAAGSVDTNFFKPLAEKIRDNKEFVVIWTGNHNRKFKGYYDYVLPAIAYAKNKRPGIVFKAKFKGSMSSLLDFYQNSDVLLNCSIGDAGPFSMIHGGAVGVPSISCSGGFADELIEDNVNGLLVSRDVKSFGEAIVKLYDDRVLLNKLKKNVLRDVRQYWGSSSKAAHWKNMFDTVLNND